jgi:hypothetical protein
LVENVRERFEKTGLWGMPFKEIIVGASLLAMVVNEFACLLAKHGNLESIASKLAPTWTSFA